MTAPGGGASEARSDQRAGAGQDDGWVSLPATLLLAAVTYAVLNQGAFFGSQLLLLQLLIGLTLIASFAAVPPRLVDLRAPSTVGCALMAGSVALSALAAGRAASAVPVVAFLATLAAVVAIVRRLNERDRRALIAGVTVVCGVVAAAGWTGVAFRVEPLAILNGELWRASSTITYANASASLLVMIALLALARLVVRGRDTRASVASWLALVGAGATLSRGGALGLAAGFSLLMVSAGPRATVAASWHVATGAAVAVAGLGPSFPDDLPPRPAVAALALAAGLAVVLAGPRLGAGRTAAVVLLVGMAALWAGRDEAGRAGKLVQAARGYDISVSDRVDRWGEFVAEGTSRPVLGTGPRGFLLRYPAPYDLDVGRFAHNEYLQIWAEQGLAGLAALVASVVLLARSILRSRGPWRAGVQAALAALLVHAATDFVWNVPVVPVVGALLVGVATPTVVASCPTPGIEEGVHA